MAAADPLHDMNDRLVHATTPPEGLGIDPSQMSTETAGDLDVVPRSEIAYFDSMSAFGKSNNVPILFHFAMLDPQKWQRPVEKTHGWDVI